jgi:hypothetical protein
MRSDGGIVVVGFRGNRGQSAVPLYEDLVRRAVAAHERAASAHAASQQIRDLAAVLRAAQAGRTLLRRCAWCGRFQIGDEWLHLEAIGHGQQQITASLRAKATHGICPDCFAQQPKAERTLPRR